MEERTATHTWWDEMGDYCDVDDWCADVVVDVNIDVYEMLAQIVILAANQDVPVEWRGKIWPATWHDNYDISKAFTGDKR